jgi:hypothetical protein
MIFGATTPSPQVSFLLYLEPGLADSGAGPALSAAWPRSGLFG